MVRRKKEEKGLNIGFEAGPAMSIADGINYINKSRAEAGMPAYTGYNEEMDFWLKNPDLINARRYGFQTIEGKETQEQIDRRLNEEAVFNQAIKERRAMYEQQKISEQEERTKQDELMKGQLGEQVPKEQERQFTPTEKIAKIGLTPAVFTANLISKGLKLLTDKDIGEITTTDLIDTKAGKALGLGTAAAGAIAGGVLGATAGAGAAGTAGAVGVRGGLNLARLRVPEVIGYISAKCAGSCGALSSNVLKLFAGGVAVGVPIKMKSDAKKAISSSLSSTDLILEALQTGDMTYQEAIANIDEIENSIKSYERSMKNWNRLSILNYLGGGKDDLIDAQNAKMKIVLARNEAYRIISQKLQSQQ